MVRHQSARWVAKYATVGHPEDLLRVEIDLPCIYAVAISRLVDSLIFNAMFVVVIVFFQGLGTVL